MAIPSLEKLHEEYQKTKGIKPKNKDGLHFAIITIIGLCALFGVIAYTLRDRVTQKYQYREFVTRVWKGLNLVQSWHTPLDKVTDSLKTAQRLEGERLLKLLK